MSALPILVLAAALGCAPRAARGPVLYADGRTITDAELDAADHAYFHECPRDLATRVSVDLANGVDRCEARVLAEQQTGPIGCGGVGTPIDFGAYWWLPVREGIAGDLTGSVRVDKRTGAASLRSTRER